MPDNEAEKFHIRLHVYDEDIDVGINRSDEAFYRAAAKTVTERYNVYADIFKGHKSDHTIALMTLIDVALKYEKERQRNDTQPLSDILNKLNDEIAKALDDTK